jgi:hypothetical protein
MKVIKLNNTKARRCTRVVKFKSNLFLFTDVQVCNDNNRILLCFGVAIPYEITKTIVDRGNNRRVEGNIARSRDRNRQLRRKQNS